jgi:hypothetical protein
MHYLPLSGPSPFTIIGPHRISARRAGSDEPLPRGLKIRVYFLLKTLHSAEHHQRNNENMQLAALAVTAFGIQELLQRDGA